MSHDGEKQRSPEAGSHGNGLSLRDHSGRQSSSYAQKPAEKAFSQDKSVIAAERFLKSIRTLKAPFVQAASSGGYARGNLYIERPGNLRIDYDKPTSLQVYADGTWLIYVDEELKGRQPNPPRGDAGLISGAGEI